MPMIKIWISCLGNSAFSLDSNPNPRYYALSDRIENLSLGLPFAFGKFHPAFGCLVVAGPYSQISSIPGGGNDSTILTETHFSALGLTWGKGASLQISLRANGKGEAIFPRRGG